MQQLPMMKGLVESTELPSETLNVAVDEDGAQTVASYGLHAPANEDTTGVHLEIVTQLRDVPRETLVMLVPVELVERYGSIVDALTWLVGQIAAETGSSTLPGRDHSLLDLAEHTSCVMRCFLREHSDDSLSARFGELESSSRAPQDVTRFALESEQQLRVGGAPDAVPDPPAVIVDWGLRSHHELLEREVGVLSEDLARRRASPFSIRESPLDASVPTARRRSNAGATMNTFLRYTSSRPNTRALRSWQF